MGWILLSIVIIGLMALLFVALWGINSCTNEQLEHGELHARRVVIPPSGIHWNAPYLIEGKEYPIIVERERSFTIQSETGSILYCLKTKCPHLSGKDWIIKEEFVYR